MMRVPRPTVAALVVLIMALAGSFMGWKGADYLWAKTVQAWMHYHPDNKGFFFGVEDWPDDSQLTNEQRYQKGLDLMKRAILQFPIDPTWNGLRFETTIGDHGTTVVDYDLGSDGRMHRHERRVPTPKEKTGCTFTEQDSSGHSAIWSIPCGQSFTFGIEPTPAPHKESDDVPPQWLIDMKAQEYRKDGIYELQDDNHWIKISTRTKEMDYPTSKPPKQGQEEQMPESVTTLHGAAMFGGEGRDLAGLKKKLDGVMFEEVARRLKEKFAEKGRDVSLERDVKGQEER